MRSKTNEQFGAESLSDHENFYRTLFEFSPSGILIEDKNGRILDANSAWCKLMGYKKNEIIGKKIHVVAHPENYSTVDVNIKKILAGQKIKQVLKSIRKDGTECYIQLNECRITLPNGEPGILNITLDMTKETKAQKALIDSEKSYKSLFNNATDAIYIQDKNGKFLDVNQAVVKMYGYSRKFYLGKTPEPLSAPGKNDLKKISVYVEKAFEGKPQQFEFWGKRKNGEIFPKIVRLNNGTYFGKDVIFAFALDITDQKRAEQKLLESEEKFRSLVETTNDWIWEVDKNIRYTYCSPTVEKILGYYPKEFIGKQPYDLMPKDEAQRIKSKVQKFFKQKIPFANLENRNIHKNGNPVILETNAIPFFDAKGKFSGYRGIDRDITARKNAELKMKESEEKFRSIFTNFSVGTGIVSLDGRFQIVNKKFADIVGYSIEELQIMRNDDLTYPEDIDETRKQMKLLFERKIDSFNLEKRLIHKNGNIVWVDLTVKPKHNAIGEIESVIGVVQDITERKKAAREINRLATVVEQAVESIVITDIDGTIIYVNAAFEKITGYKKSEVIGQNPGILKSGKHGKEFYEDLWSTILSGNKWQGVIINKRKNGSLYYEKAVIFPIKNEFDKVINFTAIIRDITLERKLERQLQQVQKMEAIGTLSGGIAHDFNNILTVINGHAEIGLMNVDKSNVVHDDLISILNAGKRAEKLTNQLLAFSRKQIHELKVIDINQTIKDLGKMLRRLIPEDIKIISEFPEDLPFIKADPGQIEQILINLIINARDAINEKQDKRSRKKIIVKTELVDLDHLFVDTHPGSQTGPHILLSVKDNGIGMSVDVQNRIFEPFFTTKDVDRGTGLGLATVYGIIKQNEGSIYVISEIGKGTTLEIYWPITTESPDKDYIETINQKAFSGKETILFVEDNEDVRQFACVALKSFGYNIIEANNGKNALQLVKKQKTSIDLIITDLIMPEMNGQKLASMVHKLLPDLKVLFVSGYTFEHLVKDGEIDESINFLQKPYTIQNILKSIRNILDEK